MKQEESYQHISNIFSIIKSMMNRVLSFDPETLKAITRFSGKVIAFDIVNIDLKFYLYFTDQGIDISANCDGQEDVLIRATPSVFFAVLINSKISQKNMEIIGDAELAQDFQDIVHNIDIDWEEYLSHFTGDYAAHKLANVFKHANSFTKRTIETVAMDISEYLRYEKEMLLDKSEIDEFLDAVDEIRNDFERLKQRIEKLSVIPKQGSI